MTFLKKIFRPSIRENIQLNHWGTSVSLAKYRNLYMIPEYKPSQTQVLCFFRVWVLLLSTVVVRIELGNTGQALLGKCSTTGLDTQLCFVLFCFLNELN